MKKEVFAAALLAVIFALSVANAYCLDKLTGEIIELVDESGRMATCGEWEKSQEAAENASRIWKEQDPYTHIVLRHSDIESMNDDFYELLEHVYSHDAGATSSSAALVSEHLSSINQIEQIRIGSVF